MFLVRFSSSFSIALARFGGGGPYWSLSNKILVILSLASSLLTGTSFSQHSTPHLAHNPLQHLMRQELRHSRMVRTIAPCNATNSTNMRSLKKARTSILMICCLVNVDGCWLSGRLNGWSVLSQPLRYQRSRRYVITRHWTSYYLITTCYTYVVI